MADVWLTTLGPALLAAAIFLLVAYRRRCRDLPPGPTGVPVVGYLPWLDPANPHLTLTKLAERYGAVYSVRLGGVLAVVVSDAAVIREALSSNEFNGRAPLYLTHGIMNGNGIICAEGDKWKEQRKFVTSKLRHFGMVKVGERRCKMEADIKRGLRDLIEDVEKADGGPLDAEPILMHALGNVVFRLVFGRTWSRDDETWKRLLAYQEEGTKLIGVAGPINFLPFLRFLPEYRKILRYIRDGISDTHKIYDDILEEYKRGDSGPADHFLAAFDSERNSRGEDVGWYTRDQRNYLMADLWGAGVDTTIATLRWFFLYMARNPEIQVRVQKEMDTVVDGEELSLSHVPSLPLLQACISETQRIRSVTPLGIPHGALRSTFVAGYRIPKGSMLVPLQWAVHMNPSLHRDPEVYDPSRFLADDGKYRKLDAFLPFQTGKRTCLGEEYAKMMLFLFGGEILRRFTLAAGEDASFDGDVGITLTPKHHKITFSPRTGGGGSVTEERKKDP